MSDTAERVKKIVVEHLNVDADKVTDTASFIEDLGADSLDTVELVMAFEEEFGIEIPDDAAESIVTVGDAVKYHRQGATPLKVRRDSDAQGRCHRNGSGHAARLRRRGNMVAAARRKIRRQSDHQVPRSTIWRRDRLPGRARRRSDGTFNADPWVDAKEQRRVDDFIVYGLAAATTGGDRFGLGTQERRGTLPHRRDDRIGHRRACRHRGSLDPAARKGTAQDLARSSFRGG